MASPLCSDAQPQSDGYVHDVIQLEDIPITSYQTLGTTPIAEETALNVSKLSYSIDIYSTFDIQGRVWNRKYISLKNNSSHGFITKKSLGTAKKVTVKWYNNNLKGSVLIIYGKDTPYSSTSDIKSNDENVRGTEIAKIYATNNVSTEESADLSSNQYKYIAISQGSTATSNITSLDIAWQQTEYERDVTPESLNTLCLPYDAEIPDYMKVYEVLGKTMNGNTPESIDFVPVNKIETGTPYVFITDKDCNKLHLDLEGEQAVSTAGNNNGLYGTFEKHPFASDKSYSEGNYFIINSNSEIQAASSNSGVTAYRAFIRMDEVPDLAKLGTLPPQRLSVSRNGFYLIDETTSINDAINGGADSTNGIYDLSGRKCTNSSSLHHGIYVAKGRKIIK